MVDLLKKAERFIDKSKLWVNPDCGLKTRGWAETKASLIRMVEAAKELRIRITICIVFINGIPGHFSMSRDFLCSSNSKP